MAYNAVDESMMVAAMLHFSTCDNASDQKWTEPKIRLNGKWYHFDFVLAALDHAVTCPGAQSLNIRVNPFASNQETAMLDIDPSDMPKIPAALDVASNALPGVILVASVRGNEQHFDLLKVASYVPKMQLSRIKTVNVTAVEIVRAEDWGDQLLDAGQELNLHEITGGGQYLIIGEWAYPVEDILQLLERNGGHMQLDDEYKPYTPPAWALQQAPQVQETAPGSGLTELPSSDTSFVDDEPQDDADDAENTEDDFPGTTPLNTTDYYWWYTLAQRWALMVTGSGTGVITLITLLTLLDQRTDFNPVLSVGIALIGSLNLTLGAGFLGSVAASRTVEDPQFARDEAHAHQIIWVVGSIIGSAVLTLIDLMFLL